MLLKNVLLTVKNQIYGALCFEVHHLKLIMFRISTLNFAVDATDTRVG